MGLNIRKTLTYTIRKHGNTPSPPPPNQMEVDIIEFFWPSNLSTKTGRVRNKIDDHNTSIHRCFGGGRGGEGYDVCNSTGGEGVKIDVYKKSVKGGGRIDVI